MTEKSYEAKADAPKKAKSARAVSAKGLAQARARGPTDAQLNERDWHKAGPRRQAGPPLAASGLGTAAASLSAKDLPPTTDPK